MKSSPAVDTEVTLLWEWDVIPARAGYTNGSDADIDDGGSGSDQDPGGGSEPAQPGINLAGGGQVKEIL